MLDVLAPPLRIMLVTGFMWLAKRGVFTWLTPENYHDLANQIMDFLVVAVPAAYMVWAGVQEWRRKRAAEHAAEPKVMIEAVAALPEVRVISLNDADMAADIPSGKVIP